jgi:hypothetical protein
MQRLNKHLDMLNLCPCESKKHLRTLLDDPLKRKQRKARL